MGVPVRMMFSIQIIIRAPTPSNRGPAVQRVTVTMEDELLAELDGLVARRGYQNRSEALRDLARAGLRRAEPPDPARPAWPRWSTSTTTLGATCRTA